MQPLNRLLISASSLQSTLQTCIIPLYPSYPIYLRMITVCVRSMNCTRPSVIKSLTASSTSAIQYSHATRPYLHSPAPAHTPALAHNPLSYSCPPATIPNPLPLPLSVLQQLADLPHRHIPTRVCGEQQAQLVGTCLLQRLPY